MGSVPILFAAALRNNAGIGLFCSGRKEYSHEHFHSVEKSA
jgi:hypothetical protein